MLLRGSPMSDIDKPAGAAPEAVLSRDGGSAASRGSVTPVPERLWAIRNVANSLARFGEGGEGQVGLKPNCCYCTGN